MPFAALALALSASSQVRPAESDESPPAAYVACAADYWRGLLEGGSQAAGRFDCTQRFLETIPGHAGGNTEMLEARSRALGAAERYIQAVLLPEVRERLEREVDARGDYVMAKSRMLDTAVGAARLYDQALCEWVDEAVGPGRYRRIAADNCRIRNRDRLIEDLLRARIDLTQGIDEE